jgi:hypothetical protein
MAANSLKIDLEMYKGYAGLGDIVMLAWLMVMLETEQRGRSKDPAHPEQWQGTTTEGTG